MHLRYWKEKEGVYSQGATYGASLSAANRYVAKYYYGDEIKKGKKRRTQM
jgi:hypothetical protein